MAKKMAAKNSDDKPISKREELAVDKLLESISDVSIKMPRAKNKAIKSKELRERNIEVVRKVLSELVGPYIIIGFDLNDGPFADFNCSSNPMEHKATMALFEEVARPILHPPMMFDDMDD